MKNKIKNGCKMVVIIKTLTMKWFSQKTSFYSHLRDFDIEISLTFSPSGTILGRNLSSQIVLLYKVLYRLNCQVFVYRHFKWSTFSILIIESDAFDTWDTLRSFKRTHKRQSSGMNFGLQNHCQISISHFRGLDSNIINRNPI